MKWIKVNEKLPESGKRVLMALKSGFVCEGYLSGYNNRPNCNWYRNGFNIKEYFRNEVIAWMPLPEYKEDIENG